MALPVAPDGAVFFLMAQRLAPLAVALLLGAALAPLPVAGQDRLDLKIAATTDVHGRLRAWDYSTGRPDSLRGLTRIATIVDSLRSAARGRVVLVDAGDLLQGNAMTYVAGRVDSLAPNPVIVAMNAMRYDAAAVGNHEFNYGVDQLDRALSSARFPFLAANTRRLDGGTPFAGRTMVVRSGVRIAIIGVTTPGSMVWDRDHLRGRFIVDDIVAAVPREVAAARAEGADVVVVVAHSGLGELTSYDTLATGLPSENAMARVAREVPGIDVMVIGHSHRQVTDSTINGVLVVQPRNWATSLAVATVSLERQGGRWRVAAKRGETVQAQGWPEHRALARALEGPHRAAIRYATTAIGTTAADWRADSARVTDTPIIDLIQDVQRRVSGAELSIASVFSPNARFEPGAITVERVVDLYPYENTLRSLRLSGAQIRAFLEQSARYWVVERSADGALRFGPDRTIPGYNYDLLAGLDYVMDLSQPMGRRITVLAKGGVPVADHDSFTVAVNSYRASGGGGYDMLRGAPVIYQGTAEIRELIVEEIRRRGTISPEDVFVRNWTLLPPRRSLRVLAINDLHGGLEKRPDGTAGNRGGAAELAAMLRDAAAECAPVCTPLVLHGGDLFQGTPASNLAYGSPVVGILQQLGVAAGALGNHEFDWGQDTLRARMRQLGAPILGANVTYADGTDVPWIPDDTLLVVDGVKVGVIGIADPATPRTTMPTHVADLRFVDPAPVVRQRAPALRARGAQLVIVVAHLGGFCDRAAPDDCRGEIFAVARALDPGTVDAIVSGHTHSEVRAIVNGIPIVQARSSGRALGIIDLPLTSGRAVPRPEVRAVVSDSVTSDPAVAAIVAAAVDAVADRTGALVATTDVRWPRDGAQFALGNLIADAQRSAGRGDVGVMNNGGIRAELGAGEIRWWSLYEVQPFENRLVVVTVRGDALRRYLEGIVGGNSIRHHLSGVTVDYDPSAPAGRRIVRVVIADGARLDDRRRYRVVMTNFLAAGGDGVSLAADAPVEELGSLDLDAMIAYLRALPGGRLVMTDALRAPRIRAAR
ncbi:MAG: 5'-nucleotidase C-terminal domain-containing protein [Gemmatimonadaceae bacterium]